MARQPHNRSMQLSSTLAWLVDAAGETPGADRLLAELGTHLLEGGLPLAGGALSLAVPPPLIARRSFLWRAESGEGLQAPRVAPREGRAAGEQNPSHRARPAWRAGMSGGAVT